jgi:hypothetical protein
LRCGLFTDILSDGKGDDIHMGYRDGVSKYADSDSALGNDDGMLDDEEDVPDEDWYHLPAWKLMHEYILCGGERDLTFDEGFRGPLAHWRDELVGSLTGRLVSPEMENFWALPRNAPKKG